MRVELFDNPELLLRNATNKAVGPTYQGRKFGSATPASPRLSHSLISP
jgi:hypothetical protein